MTIERNENDKGILARAVDAAHHIGKSRDYWYVIGEGLSVLRKEAMDEIGMTPTPNKPPTGKKYNLAFGKKLDDFPAITKLFKSNSTRSRCVWLWDHKGDVEAMIADLATQGRDVSRLNNPENISRVFDRYMNPEKAPARKAVAKEADAQAADDERAKLRADLEKVTTERDRLFDDQFSAIKRPDKYVADLRSHVGVDVSHAHVKALIKALTKLDGELSAAKASCLRLLEHCIRRADSRADCTAGSNNAIKMPMIVMTTNNSTSVNPRRNATRETGAIESLAKLSLAQSF